MIFNPYAILGVLLTILAAFAGGYVKGMHDTDQSAKVHSLEQAMVVATATLKQKQAEADNNAKLAQEFRDREENATSQIKDMQDAIDSLTQKEADKPAADVCRLNDDDLRSLRDLAIRARVRAPNTAPASGTVRKSH